MTNRAVDQAVAAIAAEQAGKFARDQVLESGGDDDVIDHRLGSGRWRFEAPGTYGFPGVPDTYVGKLWVAHLAVGRHASLITHEAAAELRDVAGFLRGQITLSVSHGDHPRLAGARIHEPRDFALREFTLIHGLPVETIPWIFVDMAATLGRRTARLNWALQTAVNNGDVTPVEVGNCLRLVARRGKPGVRSLTAALDALSPGRAPKASVLERELDELIERFGLWVPRRQYPHPGTQFVTGCVDRAYPEAKLIIESDGRRWHTRIQDMKRDRERDNDAARAGWQTLRLLREHIKADPEGTAATIRETYNVRLAQLAAIAR